MKRHRKEEEGWRKSRQTFGTVGAVLEWVWFGFTAGFASVCAPPNYSLGSTPPGTPVSAWCVNQVSRGHSYGQRVGRGFRMISLHLKGYAFGGQDWNAGMLGLALVYDRHPQPSVGFATAVIPAASEVFEQQFWESLSNLDNEERFIVLHRFDFKLIGGSRGINYETPAVVPGDIDSYVHVATGDSICHFDEEIPLFDLVTMHTEAGAAGTLVSMVEGSLLLYAVGNGNEMVGQRDIVNTDNNAYMNISARLTFKDL